MKSNNNNTLEAINYNENIDRTISITWLTKQEIIKFLKKWITHSELRRWKRINWVFIPEDFRKILFIKHKLETKEPLIAK